MKNILAVVFILGLMISSFIFGGNIAVSNSYSGLDDDLKVEIYTTKKPKGLECLTVMPYYIIKTSVGERDEVADLLNKEKIEIVGESVILPDFNFSKKDKILKMFNIKTYETVYLDELIVLEGKNAQVAFSSSGVKVGFPRILGSF